MTADQMKRVEELHRGGMAHREIAAAVGLGSTTAYRHLRSRKMIAARKTAGATVGAQGKPMGFSYSPPHIFDDELGSLTPNQIEERRVAELRGFEIDLRRRMTADEAIRIFHLSHRELEHEFGITTEQAKVMVEVARKTMTERTIGNE